MTMIEVLVAVAIFAAVALTLTTILFSTTRGASRTSKRADEQGSCRQALSLMTTEIRQAGADPSIPPAGIVGIASADSLSIHVRADLNGDGVIQLAEPSEDVAYAWNPATRVLSRDPGTGPVPVLANVTALTLSYFDATGSPLPALPLSASDAALVRSVGVSLTGSEGDAQPITLSTRITLRNR